MLIDAASKYASYLITINEDNILFRLPEKVDRHNLITPNLIKKCEKETRFGFEYQNCLDSEISLDQANYCIYCHNQEKDYCSSGNNPAQLNKTDKDGCPLKQKISEMNYVKAQGFNLAALAIIAIDNPLLAATGHRICNDCKKSCIFQKQEAVDIPTIESEILQTILQLPWGFEIYFLLTRWNPLNLISILPAPATGYNILVTGLGPAGFALSYYLLHSGHNVVAIDGFKISELASELDSNCGEPIKYWQKHQQKLSKKLPQGFGGVMEYGITPRWDKNNLTIIKIILERYKNFTIYGSVRLGSNITLDQAMDFGFDHVALCIGAGAPKFLKNNFFAKGVRTAAEFLIAVQSSGAFLKDSNVNLVIRLPIAIIGCGLTAVDAAVEAMNYYPVQVAKFLELYESLIAKYSYEIIKTFWTQEELLIIDEFIAHARLFKTKKTAAEVRKAIIDELGGVTIYYHGELVNSASYKLNHEEISYALAAGIKFVSNAMPYEVIKDQYNYCSAIKFETFTASAKTVLIAIGTEKREFPSSPNILPISQKLDFKIRSEDRNVENYLRTGASEILKNQFLKDRQYISYWGDADPIYAGSVVKAIASAKDGHIALSQSLNHTPPKYLDNYSSLVAKLNSLLISKVKEIHFPDNNTIELTVTTPIAAQNFQPGQFFKLQNYSTDPKKIMEPIAITGAEVNKDKGTVKFFINRVGLTSSLCKNFKPGEKIALMGPIGKSRISEIINKKVMIIGSGIKNLLLMPITKLLKEQQCEITHLAYYNDDSRILYPKKIQQNVDRVVWCSNNDKININCKTDFAIQGSVIDGLGFVSKNISKEFDYIICALSIDKITSIKQNIDKYFEKDCRLIQLTNTAMQCMMQGVCGQCITGFNNKQGYVFACTTCLLDSNLTSLTTIQNRLTYNAVQEKLVILNDR